MRRRLLFRCMVAAAACGFAACTGGGPVVADPSRADYVIDGPVHPFRGGRPLVGLASGTEGKVLALADTGSTRSVLRVSERSFRTAEAGGARRSAIGTAAGRMDALEGSFRLNGRRHPCYFVREGQARWGKMALLLGLDVLSDHGAVFDYREGVTRLATDPSKGAPRGSQLLVAEPGDWLVILDTGAGRSSALNGRVDAIDLKERMKPAGEEYRFRRADGTDISRAMGSPDRKVVRLGFHDQSRMMGSFSVLSGTGTLRR